MLKRKSGESVRIVGRDGLPHGRIVVQRVFPGLRAAVMLQRARDPIELIMKPDDEFSFDVGPDTVRVILARIENRSMTLGFDAPIEVRLIRPGWKGEQAALAAAG